MKYSLNSPGFINIQVIFFQGFMTVMSNSFYIVGWARAIIWYMCKVHRSDCPVIKHLDYKVFINYQKM